MGRVVDRLVTADLVLHRIDVDDGRLLVLSLHVAEVGLSGHGGLLGGAPDSQRGSVGWYPWQVLVARLVLRLDRSFAIATERLVVRELPACVVYCAWLLLGPQGLCLGRLSDIAPLRALGEVE